MTGRWRIAWMHSPTCLDSFHKLCELTGTISEVYTVLSDAESRAEYFREWHPCYGFWVIEDDH